MKAQVFRGNTKGMVFFSCLLYILLIGFSVWVFYIFSIGPIPVGVCIFISSLVTVFLLIPGILYLIESMFSYFKRVEVFENQLVLVYPFKKRKVIHTDELSCWGCVSYAPRSSLLFLCTADRDAILNYLDLHSSLCERIFGMHRISQLKQSDEGIWQLAVGTYLYKCSFCPQQDVFILNHGTTRRLKTLVNILKRDALITGPWLIDTISAWEEYAKYQPDTKTIYENLDTKKDT